MAYFEILKLRNFVDPRGYLTVLDKELPFAVKRMYWIHGAGGQTRGGHRHHVNHQAMVAMVGSVTIYMDDGNQQAEIVLNEPWQCLLVAPKDWHTMTFRPGSVLMVMASHPYDENDYIKEPYE